MTGGIYSTDKDILRSYIRQNNRKQYHNTASENRERKKRKREGIMNEPSSDGIEPRGRPFGQRLDAIASR